MFDAQGETHRRYESLTRGKNRSARHRPNTPPRGSHPERCPVEGLMFGFRRQLVLSALIVLEALWPRSLAAQEGGAPPAMSKILQNPKQTRGPILPNRTGKP